MKKKMSFPIVQILVLLLLYLAVFLTGNYLLQTELKAVLAWWAVLVLLGIVCYPLTELMFSGFHDGGFLFSKAIGVALTGWLMWLFSSLHWMKFTRVNCLIVVVIVAVIDAAFWIFAKKRPKITAWKQEVCAPSPTDGGRKLTLVLIYELLFLLLFILACYVKCFKPEAYGTEKFMDYGFMTSLMRTEYMPPEDFWFSGTDLNYYYMGQYFATFLTKLSGVTVNDGHNLALAMLLAFCFMLVYSIVFELITAAVDGKNKKRREKAEKEQTAYRPVSTALSVLLPHISGLFGGTAVTFAGNMHYTIFAKIVPTIQEMIGMEKSSYWFPNATRYIGYNPETNDKTIHEFPSYSFVLGDLHAHVTNIMFVLTVLGILLGWLFYRRSRMEAVKEGRETEKLVLWKEAIHPSIFAIGFFIGLFQMTNYWDFPIYFVVSGAIILFSNAIVTRFKKEAVILTALHAAVIVVMMLWVPLPFNLKFDSMAGGIALCTSHTPLYQLAVLWGLPVIVLVIYLLSLVFGQKKENSNVKSSYKKKRKELPVLFRFINDLEFPDLFVLTIGLCAAGLVLLPELVYVVDIYSGDYKRANTMFKLTYQAFIMFGIMMGYVIPKLIALVGNITQCICGILTGYLLCGTVGYLGTSVHSWFGDITDRSRFQSLDSAAFVEKESPSDAEAIDWINENIEGRPVMLEAPGDSYTYYQRVSVTTGLPTVIGWHTHEWLWKNNLALVDARVADVKTIYTSKDMTQVKELLELYHVEYIYIGGQEHKKYADDGGVNLEGLRYLGTVVFENEGVVILQIDK
ncbi:MAG: DUF2298 domain-containing protein [Lachnospiraceae bacterium]